MSQPKGLNEAHISDIYVSLYEVSLGKVCEEAFLVKSLIFKRSFAHLQ